MGFEVTTDRDRMDFGRIYAFLNGESYWAGGIPHDLFQRAMDNSLCFAGLLDGETVAFARVISDYATFANLVDVYVATDYRGNGYATGLMDAITAHETLQGLRRFMLATRDAHGLYARYGFAAPLFPETLMERYDPGIYRRQA